MSKYCHQYMLNITLNVYEHTQAMRHVCRQVCRVSLAHPHSCKQAAGVKLAPWWEVHNIAFLLMLTHFFYTECKNQAQSYTLLQATDVVGTDNK